jgi:hypothetical protein
MENTCIWQRIVYCEYILLLYVALFFYYLSYCVALFFSSAYYVYMVACLKVETGNNGMKGNVFQHASFSFSFTILPKGRD